MAAGAGFEPATFGYENSGPCQSKNGIKQTILELIIYMEQQAAQAKSNEYIISCIEKKARFMKALEKDNDIQAANFMKMVLYTGMRRGELFRLKWENSEYIFPGKEGKQRIDIKKAVNRIKKRAELPRDFRPLHGLRHVYASMLASSCQ